jgi:hypothetical protein
VKKSLVGNITNTVLAANRRTVDARLGNEWDNRTINQVPFVSQLYWNHRLDIQHVQNLVIRARIEIGVILKRHTDEIRYRVLRLLGKLRGSIGRRMARQEKGSSGK